VPLREPPSSHQLVIEAADARERIDRYVAAHLPELSRTRVQELIEAGLVRVDGRSTKGSHRLRAGERIAVTAEPRPPLRAEAETIPLEILYEDDDLLVVNKPAGMTVHAGAGQSRGTLVNALLGRGQALSAGGGFLRPGIVHRLDKETSGAIIVAKNDAAHARLGEAFRCREVSKTYLALVEGHLPEASGRIDLAIGRDPKRRVRMATRKTAELARAREARTDWRALARLGSCTLVEVQLHTGRTHQIRVHFSALRHPIVGDLLYGAGRSQPAARQRGRAVPTSLPALGRNFLHAAKLGFAQPRTGAWIEIRAPLPAELLAYLRQLAASGGEEANRIDAMLGSYL
jgi:23S rRNA pseudouridine1911/1915/1917 synthase